MNVNRSSIVTILTVSAAGVRCLFFRKVFLMGMVLGKCGIGYDGVGWRTLVKIGRGTAGVEMVDRYVELKNLKGFRTMQLYSTKAYSHPTAYVYSRRLA